MKGGKAPAVDQRGDTDTERRQQRFRWLGQLARLPAMRIPLSNESFALLARLGKESFRKHWRTYAIAIAAMLVIAATTALGAWIMRDITNEFVVDKDISRIYGIASFVATIFFAKGIATYIQLYALARAGNAIIAERQKQLYDRVLRQGIDFFTGIASSDLVLRFTHNAQMARQVIDTIVTGFVRDLFTLVALVAVMVIQQPYLSLVAVTVAPIALLVVGRLVGRVRSIMNLELQSIARIVQVVQETSHGAKIIKSFGLDNRMRAQMSQAVSDVENRANKIARLEAATSPLMETLAGFAIAGVIVIGAQTVIARGESPGELMSFITALLLAYEPAKRLARMRVSIEAGLVGVKMMFELLDRPLTQLERAESRDLSVTSGEIRFVDVGFAYPDRHPVLEDFSLHIPAGRMTALVGPSGSGKSTIISLTMRLYDPNSGQILIDGQDLAAATFSSIRNAIAYVSQDTFLFSGNILDNIRVGREGATDEEVIEAAKEACAHDFIESLPEGYRTDVGENGIRLSGGQKQRLAIARAILRDAPILILDEATSALDAESEASVRTALERASRGRTTIAIAHRFSTVRKADVIYVIEDGRVVESGTHASLREAGGIYSTLCEHQLL